MRSLSLAALLVVVWVCSWWGPRRFRLWWALLAPVGTVAAGVAAFLSVPAGSCDHGCVQGWAAEVDGSAAVANAWTAFPVALAIAGITGIVELVLFVRRHPPGSGPPSGPV